MKNEIGAKFRVLLDKEVKSKSISQQIYNCYYVKGIKFIKFNTGDFTDYKNKFDSCNNLIDVDISKLKTDNVENISYMFNFCSSLKELDLSKFKTNNVLIVMNDMLCFCNSIRKLELSNFKTDKVIDMSYLFFNCYLMKELNYQILKLRM